MVPVERVRQYTAAAKGYLEMIARAEDGAEQRDLIGRALAALDKHEELCRASVAAFRAAPVWLHHRGGRYRVLGPCLFQIRGSPLDGAQGFVYRALENPALPLFVRPMDEWADEVAPGVLRFVPVAASAPTTCGGASPHADVGKPVLRPPDPAWAEVARKQEAANIALRDERDRLLELDTEVL